MFLNIFKLGGCTNTFMQLIMNYHNKHMVTIMNTVINATTDTTNKAVVAQDNENVEITTSKVASQPKAKAALAAQRKKARDTTSKLDTHTKTTHAKTDVEKTDNSVQKTTRMTHEVKGVTKQQRDLLNAITKKVHKATRGSKLSTLHILTIKHSDEFDGISAKQFCTITNLPKAYGIEFIRIGSISNKLKECGLDVTKL